MSVAAEKRFFKGQVVSANYLWVGALLACFVVIFSVCSANIDFRVETPNLLNIDGSITKEESKLTKAVQNILKERLVTNSNELTNTIAIIKQKIRRELKDFRIQIENAHNINTHNETSSNSYQEDIFNGQRNARRKRDTITADTLVSVREKRNISAGFTSDDPFVINKVFRVDKDIFSSRGMLDINVVDMGKHGQFLFTVQETENGIYTFIYFLEKDFKVRQLKQIKTPSATTVEVTRINNQWYFIPVEGNYSFNVGQDPLDVGSHVYRFDIATNNVYKEQTIDTSYAKKALFWKGSGEEANTMYMAVLPQYRVNSKGLIRNNVHISCYHWQGGYLDYVFSIPANNPQSLEHFNIFDNDYLAVANYQDDTKSTTIYSEIFKYNHRESNYVPFQRILTYGAKDIKYFRLSNGLATEHFLAIANYCRRDLDGKCEFRLRSVIYKFSGDRFVPFQTIKTNGALQFLPLASYRKFLLCIVELHGIKFFQYNGWNFVEQLQTTFDDPLAFPDNIKLRSFVKNSLPHFSIASTQVGIFSGLYSFEFHQMNNFATKVDDLYGWCSGAARILVSANISDIYQKLLKAPKFNDEKIHLHGSLEFKNVGANSLHSKSFEYNNFTYGGNFYKDMNQKFHTLDTLHGKMKEMEKSLSNVVYRNRNQTVQGKIVFFDVDYRFPHLTANMADIIRLNNFKIQDMLPKLLHLSKNYSLDQFSAEHIIAKDSVAIPNLNGHPIFDYAIKSHGIPQKFTGHNTFLRATKAHNGFDVLATLNGIHFTDNNINFFLKQGNQTFTGPIVLTNSTAKYLYTKYLNGVDVNYYFRDAVLISGSSIITGNKKFSSVAVKHLFTENILSDVNVNDLANRAIYRKGKPSQSFTGKQTQFQKLIVDEMAAGSSVIGGNHDLRNFVNVREESEDYKIEELTLSGGGKIHKLQVNQKLNEYGINSNGRPDILLSEDSKRQHIRRKFIKAFYFEKDVDAEDGTINGIHFPSWSNIHRLFLENNHIEGWMDIRGLLEAPAIIVKGVGTHNEKDVLHALSHIARLDSKTLPGQCNLIFDAIKVNGNTHVSGNVNGYDPNLWLRRFSQDVQIISAPKSFLNDLSLLQNIRVTELYDLNHRHGKSENIIAVLPNLLTYSGNQTLVGDIQFNRLLTIDNLYGNVIFLDGVPFKNIMLTTGNHTISTKSIFMGDVEVRDRLAVGNISAGSYNEIDLEKAINNTLYKNSPVPQIIRGIYTFDKGFSVENMNTHGRIKNYDLSELVRGLVKINNGIIHINGTVVFKQGASIENLSYNGLMNGISNKDWGKNWLLNDHNQEVSTPVKFKTLKVENIQVRNDKVSGINIAQLNANSIKTNEPSELHSVTFSNGVKFLKGIGLSENALVNGHNLLKNTLLTDYDGVQVLAGEVTFLDGFTVEGNVVAHSLGCPQLDLIAKFAHGQNKESHKAQKLVVTGNMELEHEPEIINSINSKNWKNFLSDVWWIDRDTEINREVEFENVVLQKGIVLYHGPILSGINLKDLQKYYAGRNKNNEWTEEVYFNSGMVVQNNFTCRDIEFKNGALLNKVNINEFMNPHTVMMNGVNQTIRRPMTFSSLTADKIKIRDGVKINSYNLQTDFMTIGGQNHFVSPKKFGDITVANNTQINGGTKISGVNMQHWKQHAVNKHKHYNFSRPMFFDNIYADEMSVKGKVNNLKYSQDTLFLTTRRNQIIRGVVTIDGTRRPNTHTMNATEIIVQHTINGYNFDKSAKNLVMKGNRSDTSPIVLTGTKKFSGPVYVNQMKISNDKLIYGENMTKILHEISSFTHLPQHLKVPLKDRYIQLQNRITELQNYAPDQPVFMAHYELVSYINFPSVYIKVVHIDGFPLLSLGIKRPHSIIETSHWSFNWLKNSYSPFDRKVFQNHVQGCIVDFAEVKINGYAAVITTKRVDMENKPVHIDLPLQPLNNNYELYKAEGKLNKAFVLLRIKSKLAVTQVFYGHEFGKILPFYLFTKSNLKSCVIIQFFDIGNAHADVFCFNDNNVMYFVQSISMKNPTAMTSMIVSRKTIIAIGDRDDKSRPEGIIDIWTYGDGGLMIKESCIPIINLVHLDSMWTSNDHPFLAVAVGYVRGTRNFGAVYIYRYSTHKKIFEKIQTIEIANPLRVRFQLLQVSNEVVLYVLKSSEIDNILVFKYQGIAGWVQVHQFTSEKATEIEVLDFQLQNEYYAHLALSSYTETKVFAVRFKGKNYYDQGLIVKGKT